MSVDSDSMGSVSEDGSDESDDESGDESCDELDRADELDRLNKSEDELDRADRIGEAEGELDRADRAGEPLESLGIFPRTPRKSISLCVFVVADFAGVRGHAPLRANISLGASLSAFIISTRILTARVSIVASATRLCTAARIATSFAAKVGLTTSSSASSTDKFTAAETLV